MGSFQLPVNLFDQFSGRRMICSSVHPFVISNNLSIVQWSDVNYQPLSEVIVIELNLKIKTFTMACICTGLCCHVSQWNGLWTLSE